MDQGSESQSGNTTPQAAFGAVVSVKALSHRVLREENKSGDGRGELLYRERSEPVSPEVAATGDWPDPDGKSHVRICREVFPAPAFGIIVGQTKRIEGYRVPGRETAGYGAMEPDYEPAYFAGSKVVKVYEVALMVDRYRKARIVLVQPDDLTVLPSRAVVDAGS